MQPCFRCGIVQPLHRFRHDPSGRVRKNSPCWSCHFESYEKEKAQNEIRSKKWYKENYETKIKGNIRYVLIDRKFKQKHKEKIKEYNKKYRKNNLHLWKKSYLKNKEKVRCRWILNAAIKSKKIEKLSICQKCFSNGKIEAHHVDYSKPLEVLWLCIACHKKEHYKYKEQKNEQYNKI